MRETMGGWESDDLIMEGYTDESNLATPVIDNTYVRTDFNGNGGDRSIRWAGAVSTYGQVVRALPVPLYEYRHKAAVYRFNVGGNGFFWEPRYSGNTGTRVRVHVTTGVVEIRQSIFVRAASAVFLDINKWYVVEYHMKIANPGFVKVYLDGDYTAPIVEWTGDTTFGGVVVANQEAYSFNGQALDETAINSMTLRVDGAGGGPPTGTLSGTGSTAIIYHSVDLGGGVWRIWVQDWDGTPYPNDDPVTAGGGFSGNIDAPSANFVDGFEPNSFFPGTGYIMRRAVMGAGASTGLALVGAATNWQAVDERPYSEADYVWIGSGGVPAQDTYQVTDLPGAGIASVGPVRMVGWVIKDGVGVGNARMIARTGGVDYYSDDKPLPISYNEVQQIWGEDPTDLSAWTTVKIDALEAGVELKV